MKLRITIAGNTYEADVEVVEEEEASEPYVPPPPAYSPAANYPPATGSTFDDNPSDSICRSPVTGLVIRVPVEAGQAVEAGQLLLVLEAMKMETHVTAPRSGIVQKIHVEPGNSVKVNQPLIEMECETAPSQGSSK